MKIKCTVLYMYYVYIGILYCSVMHCAILHCTIYSMLLDSLSCELDLHRLQNVLTNTFYLPLQQKDMGFNIYTCTYTMIIHNGVYT